MEEKNLSMEKLSVSRKSTLNSLYGNIACAVVTGIVGLLSGATIFIALAVFFIAGIFIFLKELQSVNEKIKALEAQEHKVLDHSWEFPVKEFYEKCKALGITESNTEFTRKKIQNVAKSLMIEKGIPETAQGWYIEKAVGYFDAESNRIANETASEDKRWKTTRHTATLSTGEKSKLHNAKEVKKMYGTEKRRFLLLDAMESAKRGLANCRGSEFKPTLQKEKDWAVHGGIADGIAGPAAGVATAAKVMRENERIREQNAQLLNIASMVNRSNHAAAASYEKEIKECEEELRVLPEKVVLDNVTSAELLSAYQISVVEIHRHSERDEGCMSVRLSVTQTRSLNLDIPDGVKIVLDGSVFGRVFTAKEQSNPMIPGGIDMGEIIAPLDMYGIPYDNALAEGEAGKAYTIRGLCDHFYGDITTKYVCVLEENHTLWLMER